MLSINEVVLAFAISILVAICISGIVVAHICGFRGVDSFIFGTVIVLLSFRSMSMIIKNNHNRISSFATALRKDFSLCTSLPLLFAWNGEHIFEIYEKQSLKHIDKRIQVLRCPTLTKEIVEETVKKYSLA